MRPEQAGTPGVRAEVAGHPEAEPGSDGDEVAPRRLPPGQRGWGRGLGGVHLDHSTGAARPRAATAGHPDPRPRATEEVARGVRPWPGVRCAGPTPARQARAMITVEELSKQYGAHRPVDRVSFQARPGSVTGFLGPNGAGKSTTMRMMTGLTPPSAGRSTILGVPYAAAPQPRPARRCPAGRLGAAQRTDRTRGPPARRHRDGPSPRGGSTRCSRSSACPAPRATAGSATTPSACGSGSASRTPSWATRRC